MENFGEKQKPAVEKPKSPEMKFGEDLPLSERFSMFLVGLDLPKGKQKEAAELQKEFIQLEKHSKTDALTGLPNRRAFVEELARWEDLNKRQGDDYCLVAFDLDGLKYVNDTFGHDMGDECLRLVAEHVGKKLRPSDFFARPGGDEFIILLPEIGEGQGVAAAERIRRAIENEVSVALQKHASGRDSEKAANIRISASVGIDSKNRDVAIDAETLMRHADFASYVVKAAGKKGSLSYTEARELDAESSGELYRAFLKTGGSAE